MLKNYKELLVYHAGTGRKIWQKSYQLCLEVYTVTKKFPKSKLQGDIGEVERTLKALIKSLENKPLNPRIPDPFLPTRPP